MVDDKQKAPWVEELSDAACPLGGFTHICNECSSCRIEFIIQTFFGKVLPSISQFVQYVVYKGIAISASKNVRMAKDVK